MAEKEQETKSAWQALKDIFHGKDVPDNIRIFLFSIVNFITGISKTKK